jgi:catechol 2,3-dioxygenase-like lactoylglutathione lyase family enzyme
MIRMWSFSRFACVAALNLFLLAAGTLAQDPIVQPGERVSPVSRTTVFVRDIDESLKLYRDILGMTPRIDRVLEGEFWNAVVGTAGENKKIKVMIMQTGDEHVGNVGLFQYVDENDGPPVYKPPRLQTGDVALIFLTNDIFGIYREVTAAGYTIVSPPSNPDPDAGPYAGYEMIFFDRDGIAINLIQRARATE